MNASTVEQEAVPAKQNNRGVMLGGAIALFIVVAALLNPSQDRHFEEIEKVIQSRHLSIAGVDPSTITVLASYNNYFLFSTVTFGRNRVDEENHVLSYGFFGAVKTTGSIKSVVLKVYESELKTEGC